MQFTSALLILHKHLLYFLSSLNYTCSKNQLDAYFLMLSAQVRPPMGWFIHSSLLACCRCTFRVTLIGSRPQKDRLSLTIALHIVVTRLLLLNCCFEGERVRMLQSSAHRQPVGNSAFPSCSFKESLHSSKMAGNIPGLFDLGPKQQ